MSKCYYFFASLPFIEFDGEAILSVEDFLCDCERLLTVRDINDIYSLMAIQMIDYPLSEEIVFKRDQSIVRRGGLWDQVFNFNQTLRNELAKVRSGYLGVDSGKSLRGVHDFDLSIKACVNRITKTENLLEAEKILDKFRWDFLEALGQECFFDTKCVGLYGLKLMILCRHKKIGSSLGKEVFEDLKNIMIPEIT